MTDRITTLNLDQGYLASGAERNKVLRNTYWLLALSLVPTVLGAWIGVATGITMALTGGIGLIVFLGGAFGFMYAIEKTKNSAAGVPVLLAFTFFMGLMLSVAVCGCAGHHGRWHHQCVCRLHRRHDGDLGGRHRSLQCLHAV